MAERLRLGSVECRCRALRRRHALASAFGSTDYLHPRPSTLDPSTLATARMETTYDRRAFMAYFTSIGLGSTLLPGVLWAQAQGQQQGPEITKETIAAAEEIAGLKFSDDERAAMANGLRQARNNIQQLH